MKAIHYLQLSLLFCLSCTNTGAQQTIFEKKASLPGAIPECSGIEWTDGKLWTFNDGGHPATLYQIDSSTGAILQQVQVTNYSNTDWEDITSDDDYIYIGDFGNNNGVRKDLKILKIAKADIGTGANVNVTAQAINYSYPDQTVFTTNDKNNFDCESVISLGDSLFLFSKNLGNFQSKIYSLPKTPGTYTANYISQFDVVGKITAATINPSKNEVAILGYSSSHYGSFILLMSGYTGHDFFSGVKKRIPLTSANIDWQTEGLAYVTDKRLFLTCEKTDAVPAGLYAIDNDVVLSHVVSARRPAAPEGPLAWPNPSSGKLFINTCIGVQSYSIYNALGQPLQSDGVVAGPSAAIDMEAYPAGIYLIELKTALGSYLEKIVLQKD